MVVFGCISSQGVNQVVVVLNSTVTEHVPCVYNNSGACGFGTFVGVTAFLGLMVFIVLAAMFQNINNADHRKYIVMADIGFSGKFYLRYMYTVMYRFSEPIQG